jgi:hypothetical protein
MSLHMRGSWLEVSHAGHAKSSLGVIEIHDMIEMANYSTSYSSW